MVGIDLVFVPEFKDRAETEGVVFLEKAFHLSELKNRQPDHLAGLWAAKEAVMKAAPKQPASWLDIHISYDGEGRPWARIGSQLFELSIAHHGDYAVAIASGVAP